MDADMIDDGETVDEPNDADDTTAPTGPDADGPAGDAGEPDFDEERASEVEDVTATIHRPDDAASLAETVEHDIDEILHERESFKNDALRLQADFDNYRKRVANQQAEAVDRATGRLAEALLPVLDACEAAFLNHPAEIEPLFNLLLGEMKKQGLEAIDLLDQPFDPVVAEAVLHEPGDAGEPVVSEVLRSGYLWKGKVLRPAMVKVRG